MSVNFMPTRGNASKHDVDVDVANLLADTQNMHGDISIATLAFVARPPFSCVLFSTENFSQPPNGTNARHTCVVSMRASV